MFIVVLPDLLHKLYQILVCFVSTFSSLQAFIFTNKEDSVSVEAKEARLTSEIGRKYIILNFLNMIQERFHISISSFVQEILSMDKNDPSSPVVGSSNKRDKYIHPFLTYAIKTRSRIYFLPLSNPNSFILCQPCFFFFHTHDLLSINEYKFLQGITS